MDTPLASKELCEEFYALTLVGLHYDTDHYYDTFGQVVRRDQVVGRSRTRLPSGYTPAYSLGFLYRLLPDEIPENILIRACIEMAKHNLFSK